MRRRTCVEAGRCTTQSEMIHLTLPHKQNTTFYPKVSRLKLIILSRYIYDDTLRDIGNSYLPVSSTQKFSMTPTQLCNCILSLRLPWDISGVQPHHTGSAPTGVGNGTTSFAIHHPQGIKQLEMYTSLQKYQTACICKLLHIHTNKHVLSPYHLIIGVTLDDKLVIFIANSH